MSPYPSSNNDHNIKNNNSNNNDDNNNTAVLRETKELQQKSLEALSRTRRRAAETKQVGQQTLETLDEHTSRINQAESSTTKLEESLQKAEKAQNKFAVWSFQFGTRRKAHKELEREEKCKADKEAAAAAAATSGAQAEHEASKTFKRRGPRPKKNTTSNNNIEQTATTTTTTLNNNNNNNVVQETSKDIDAQVNRNELFSKASSSSSNSTKKASSGKNHRKRTKAANTKPKGNNRNDDVTVPLKDNENRDLHEIEDTDRLVDEGIDALGDEVNDLLAMSKAIGSKANQQISRLNTIDDKLETTQTKTKQINRRLKLFTSTQSYRMEENSILGDSKIGKLWKYLPYNFQLIYSMARDGADLQAVLEKTKLCADTTLIVVETSDGETFGAFTAKPWNVTRKFHSGPESFLCCIREQQGSSCTDGDSVDDLELYPFTGKNPGFHFCNMDRVAAAAKNLGLTHGNTDGGSGSSAVNSSQLELTEWEFGLAFQYDLRLGTSSSCVDFNSPSLSEKSRFVVSNIMFFTIAS